MKFNSRQVLCFLVIIFSVLLIGASSVCAQDTDTTDNITDDIGQNIIINENDLNMGENSTLENSITYGNNTATYTVNFGDTKMDICPMINGALNDNYTPIENFTYFGLYNGANFYLYIDHPIYDGNNTYVMLSITYMFSNLTSTGDIFSKLEKQDYGNSIMLTRTVHVNSIKSYEDARINSVNNAFSADMISACFDIFDKKNAENVPLMFADNFGRTNCLSSLRKHDITFNYNVLFDNTYNFNSSNLWDLDELGYDIIHIDGNGSTISGSANDRDEYKWANIGDNCLCVNNLTIKGFNNAIINRGICELDNVTLEENKMAYLIERDWGATVLNAGYCICNNCSFINNSASKGGAVFNQGEISFNNCTFSHNTANKGANIFNVDNGKLYFNGCLIVGDDATIGVNYDTSMSLVGIFAVSVAGSLLVGGALGYVIHSGVGSSIAGGVVGFIGGCIGALVANSYYYDINFNFKAYAIGIVIASTLSGVAGSMIGNLAYNKIHTQSTDEVKNDNNEIKEIETNTMDEHSESSDRGDFLDVGEEFKGDGINKQGKNEYDYVIGSAKNGYSSLYVCPDGLTPETQQSIDKVMTSKIVEDLPFYRENCLIEITEVKSYEVNNQKMLTLDYDIIDVDDGYAVYSGNYYNVEVPQ